MSTRCQIGFYEKNEADLTRYQALIYRHYDGYPEGVLPDIVPILQDFDKGRGMSDLEYASAWLVAKLKDDYLNIGISNGFHGDIAYLYAVYPDQIDVYNVEWDFEGRLDINGRSKKILTVPLDTDPAKITSLIGMLQ